MTEQQTFKRRIRARMAKTGESYTAARRQLLDRTPPLEQRVSDDAVERATGRPREQWFALLDEWGATHRKHPQIARWLIDKQGVPGWWARGITVAYEQARGMRVPGQQSDGLFAANVSRTLPVSLERLYAAVEDAEQRERWLPGDPLEVTSGTPGRTLNARWEDTPTRVVFGFESKGEGRSLLALAHVKLPTPEEAERMKAFWRERMDALKSLLAA